jgi:hypothetical protein
MLAQSAVETQFVSLLVIFYASIAFVGLGTGMILAFLWAIRCALGLEGITVREELWLRRAVQGFTVIIGGMFAGAVVVAAINVGPFLAVVVVVQLVFGDQPPALMETFGLALLVGIGVLTAAWFAQWWQRLVWARLPA